MLPKHLIQRRTLCFCSLLLCAATLAQSPAAPRPAVAKDAKDEASGQSDLNALTPLEQKRLDQSIERGLAWLSRQQQPDGSFHTLASGQPAVTALCELSFLSQGEKVGEGRYGDQLQRAVNYIISQQKPNGLLAKIAPSASPITRQVEHDIGRSAVYNHALSALVLTEVYGQLGAKETPRATKAIEQAITATLEMQRWKKRDPKNQGGWRYLDKLVVDSDLSITGWQLMFLRSAKNAGFDVPEENIDQAVKYIKACYLKRESTFTYVIDSEKSLTRGMAGAGILAMAHAGMHDSPLALKAGDWILEHPFDKYNSMKPWSRKQKTRDRYHYGLLTCCQAMYQLGGRHWRDFYPATVKVIIDNQRRDGSWPPESHARDAPFGSSYTTALCILSLSSANQILPIFQR